MLNILFYVLLLIQPGGADCSERVPIVPMSYIYPYTAEQIPGDTAECKREWVVKSLLAPNWLNGCDSVEWPEGREYINYVNLGTFADLRNKIRVWEKRQD